MLNLISTFRVISEDYKPNKESANASSKNINFFELDNLSSRHDFMRLRAEADSEALKKKFSDKKIYQKINLKRKDQLKSKEDVSAVEAFELYM